MEGSRFREFDPVCLDEARLASLWLSCGRVKVRLSIYFFIYLVILAAVFLRIICSLFFFIRNGKYFSISLYSESENFIGGLLPLAKALKTCFSCSVISYTLFKVFFSSFMSSPPSRICSERIFHLLILISLLLSVTKLKCSLFDSAF